MLFESLWESFSFLEWAFFLVESDSSGAKSMFNCTAIVLSSIVLKKKKKLEGFYSISPIKQSMHDIFVFPFSLLTPLHRLYSMLVCIHFQESMYLNMESVLIRKSLSFISFHKSGTFIETELYFPSHARCSQQHTAERKKTYKKTEGMVRKKLKIEFPI